MQFFHLLFSLLFSQIFSRRLNTIFINALTILQEMRKKRYEGDRSSYNSSKKSLFISGKHGQVTVFIIIGIVLLLAVVLVFFLRKEIVGFKIEELIPAKKGKVETLIGSCIAELGDEAIFNLGLKGGYIEVPSRISSDASAHLKISPFQVVPYWAIGEQTFIPTLQYIKENLDDYIEENLRNCVLALEPFIEAYDLKEKSEIESDTEIVDNGVIFNVYWNIEVLDKAGETVAEVINHIENSPIKLKRVYETAQEIVNSEVRDMKIEDLTQDLIAMEHPSLPVAGIELSCRKKTWDAREAKQTLQNLLRINIKRLQVKGTNTYGFGELPTSAPKEGCSPDVYSMSSEELLNYDKLMSGYDCYQRNHYLWNLDESFSKPEVSVVFNYDNTYPFHFQVTPTEDGKMRSGLLGGTGLVSAICLQTWKFTYDVTYPVLIRVKDDTTGYNFNVAMTIHLVRNRPDRSQGVIARPEIIFPENVNDKYCDSADLLTTIVTWESVENEEGVSDLQPLKDVNVSFACINYACPLGQTDFNFQQWGYQSGLTVNLPYCVGGILRGEKEGYREDVVRVVTKYGDVQELQLVPLFKFPLTNMNVVKHKFSGKEQPAGPEELLSKDEMALIRMKLYRNGTVFHEVEQVIGGVMDEETAKRIDVEFLAQADFTYEVELNIFDKENLIGGYKANWTMPWDELETASEIKFHTIYDKAGEENTYQLFTELGQLSNYVPLPEIK